MAIANLGSIGLFIHQRIPDIPSTISGTPMWQMIDEVRLHIENFTGDSIGSTAIAEKYQPALINLSAAAVLDGMQSEGPDVSGFTLGDLSVSQGATSNISTAREGFQKRGDEYLRLLGRRIGIYRANG